jgi:glucokinase
MVDAEGRLHFAPNLRWKDIPLREELEERFRRPVSVLNDVRAAVYYEWQYGAGRGQDHLVCVYVGTGVGGGIVCEGRLLRGATQTAGELGHLTLVAGGRPCHCRNVGCFETYVGGWAIAERAREAVQADPIAGREQVRRVGGPDRITSEALAEAARARDPLLRFDVSTVYQAITSGSSSPGT